MPEVIHDWSIYNRQKRKCAVNAIKRYRDLRESGVPPKPYDKEYYEKNKQKVLQYQKKYVEKKKQKCMEEGIPYRKRVLNRKKMSIMEINGKGGDETDL